MNIIVYGKKRQVVGYYQDPEHDGYLRLLLDGGQVYVYAVANCNSHYEKMLVEAPTEIQEAPDGNGDTLIYADGTQARTGGVVMPFTKADAEYMTAMQQEHKPLTAAQRGARAKGGRAKAQLSPDQIKIIVAEFSFVRNKSDRRRGEIVAQRCASGRWTHGEPPRKITRKDLKPITWRYVIDTVKGYRATHG